MQQIHKISIIGLFAVIIGIITVGPVMADKDSSEGHNKIDICHFDNEDGDFVELFIPENKAKGHAKNHVNDIIPAPEDGCPEQEESEDGINIELFMEDFTRHDDVITEITNSQCSLGEVVTGFGPNGELLCSPDNTGEDNSFNIISRTVTVELISGERLFEEYFCEPGEIIVGGLIEMSLDPPISNQVEILSGSEQSYKVVIETNRNQETVTVNVTYLCYDVI
ncbi:MAG: hypothetical protein O6761_00565 [Thaumarchaeota archaeon]|nr:hypothetical protein [Nitrososphaerota archaeon]